MKAQCPERGEADTNDAGRNLGGTNAVVNVKQRIYGSRNLRPKENLRLVVGYVRVAADLQAYYKANDAKCRCT